jgi:hypothetical protein
MNRRPSAGKPTRPTGVQSLKSQTTKAVDSKSRVLQSRPGLSAQEQVFASERSRLKIIDDNSIPKNNKPIQENFLTRKINWKRVLLVQNMQYAMDDHV